MILILVIVLIGSFLSTVTGMLGGVLIFSFFTLLYPLKIAVALHGAIQIFSNLSRVIMLRQFIDWSIIWKFSILLIPGCFLGFSLLDNLNEHLLKITLGIVILITTLKGILPTHKPTHVKPAPYTLLGLISGTLGMIIGTTGPLLSPFFLAQGKVKEQFVATKAACQMTMQICKVGLLCSYAEFSYRPYTYPLLIAAVALIIGTFLGKKALTRINPNIFKRVIQGGLIIIALQLILTSKTLE